MNDLDIYRWLVVCRELDRALCIENPRWFPIEGEEATVLGSFVDLRADDAVAPHYRDPFVVYLLRGAEMQKAQFQNRSWMPAAQLSAEDLQNLLAYLSHRTLRGAAN